MASFSRVDVMNTSITKTFISWKVKVASERTEFFLQLHNFQWILAVVGSVTDHQNMEFVIDPTFYGFYKQQVTNLGDGIWRRRCDVVAWLNAQISYKPFNNCNVIIDAGDFSALIDTECAKESLGFPSGYNDAYCIPSRTQMVLKHGARNFAVEVEHGRFTRGWDYFVTEHDIQYGYAVKFHFRGCSTYETEIYDTRRGKRVYPWSNVNYHQWI